jgi:trk system potassium uptake protein TrkH
LFYIIISFLATFILLLTEKNIDITYIFFEVISALSTTGLTLGITEKLSISGKIVIIILMFIGRVYILFITSKVFINSQELNLKYPEGKILIGQTKKWQKNK